MDIQNYFQLYLREPSLQVIVKREWGSLNENYRNLIRQNIFENIYPDQSVLDLKVTPQIRSSGLSISHTKSRGGYVHAPFPSTVGFDIEINDRVQSHLISRIAASFEESAAAPFLSALWTAKEAAFKYLTQLGHQVSAISDIEIGEWNEPVDQVFTCRIIKIKGNPVEFEPGIVVVLEKETSALFMRRSS